jgi:hypothetical protein
MYTYPFQELIKNFTGLLKANLNEDSFKWLEEQAVLTASANKAKFYMAFTAIPRKSAKSALSLSAAQQHELQAILPDLSLTNYTVDKLARHYLLLHWPADDKQIYLHTISELFKAAEMNELVALYSALPFLAYPEDWTSQCAEGIRSNIGTVLEAVICDNPYPAQYLSEPAWNQLVLKAIFTDQKIERIIGLEKRSNKILAQTLHDYVHERWAAGRTFNLQLWRNVGPFIDEHIFPDIQKIYSSSASLEEKCAAVLACEMSNFSPAQDLYSQSGALKTAIASGELSWNNLSDFSAKAALVS